MTIPSNVEISGLEQRQKNTVLWAVSAVSDVLKSARPAQSPWKGPLLSLIPLNASSAVNVTRSARFIAFHALMRPVASFSEQAGHRESPQPQGWQMGVFIAGISSAPYVSPSSTS